MQAMTGVSGVIGKLFWPQKSLVKQSASHTQANPVALELETAKEILAEVFKIRVSEVDEMILSRFEEVRSQEARPEDEDVLWPQEFRLDG